MLHFVRGYRQRSLSLWASRRRSEVHHGRSRFHAQSAIRQQLLIQSCVLSVVCGRTDYARRYRPTTSVSTEQARIISYADDARTTMLHPDPSHMCDHCRGERNLYYYSLCTLCSQHVTQTPASTTMVRQSSCVSIYYCITNKCCRNCDVIDNVLSNACCTADATAAAHTYVRNT